jgi:hypothetical protein
MANEIITSANAAWRDYATDGVPSSGAHEPAKSDIRTHAATVQTQVDAALALAATGVLVKDAVRVATTANGTLASGFENGDTIDGIVLATSDRILIKDQSTGAENGIYVVAATGAPTRATDANEDAELPGSRVYVQEGTANGGTSWQCSNASVTLETTALTFFLVGDESSVVSAVNTAVALAEQWAEEAEDTEVTTGQYSALHWAAKAATSAASAPLAAQKTVSSVESAIVDTASLELVMIPNAGVTEYSTNVLLSWEDQSANAYSGALHTTLFSGADPRPLFTSRGIYFNNQAGLTINNGVIADPASFAFIYSIDLGAEAITEYADKATADGAGGTEGDICKVLYDTTTNDLPDFEGVIGGSYTDSVLVNGYYNRNLGSWSIMTGKPIFTFRGAGTQYIKGYFNRLGQIEIGMYSGVGGGYAVQTNYTDVIAADGGVGTLGIYSIKGKLSLWWNGVEMQSIDVSAMSTTTFTKLYINGDTRGASAAYPVQGLRHYCKGLVSLDSPTFGDFRRAYDAVAKYCGTPVLDVPQYAYIYAKTGQSHAQGSITVTDPWSTASGWDGQVDKINALNAPLGSGEDGLVSRERLRRVRSRSTQNTNGDIGPLNVTTNSYGTIVTGASHKYGERETFEWGMFKHIINHPDAPDVDWTITGAYAGGAQLSLLSAETSPAPLLQVLKSKNFAQITFYEETLQGIIEARDYHLARGQIPIVKVFEIDQGHSDQLNAVYDTDWDTFAQKTTAAIKKITGQADDPLVVNLQINYSVDGGSNATNLIGGSASVDQMILDIVDDRGTSPYFCLGPTYQISNFIHTYVLGYRWKGEIRGKALAKILWEGEDYIGCLPTLVTRMADRVRVKFNVPVGNLQFVDSNENNIDGRVTFGGVDTYGFGIYTGTPGAFTVTIASPGVCTKTAHGLSNGNRVCLTSYGFLPTGLSPATEYFVVNATTNTFELSLTSGGASINTSGTQSSTHRVFNVSKPITSVALYSATEVDIFAAALTAGDVISYVGFNARIGNLCDQDTTVAYYQDQDWTAPFTSGSPTHALGEPNDLRNWAMAFTKVMT